MRLGFLIGITLSVVIGFAVTLTGFLNQAKFETILQQVVQARFEMHADNVRQAAENGFDLGLALSQINLQEVIDRTRGNGRHIQAVHIFDAYGRVLFVTGDLGPMVGERVPDSWQSVLTGTPPNLREAGLSGILMRLENTFGRAEGGLMLRYESSTFEVPLEQSLLDMVLTGLLVVGCSLVLSMAGSVVFVRNLTRSFSRLTMAAESLLGKRTSEFAVTLGHSEIEEAFERFHASAAPLVASKSKPLETAD